MIPNWILYPLAFLGLLVGGLFVYGVARGVRLGLRLRREARDGGGQHRESVGVSDSLSIRKIPARSREGRSLRKAVH